MKLNFDSNQSYQWDAIKSITDIFEGQPLSNGDFGFIQSGNDQLKTNTVLQMKDAGVDFKTI